MTIPIIGELNILEKNKNLYRTMMRQARQRFRIAHLIGTEKEEKKAGLEYAENKRKFRKVRNRIVTLRNGNHFVSLPKAPPSA